MLASVGGRALGSIIAKYKNMNYIGYDTYTKLFDTGVSPVLEYGSEVWGYGKFENIQQVQNKAIRIFLGVHRFAPIVGIFWNKVHQIHQQGL